jgi:hypothetical protein
VSEHAENSHGTVRQIGKPFQPGRSGNPGGRPKGVARAVRDACGGSPERLVQGLLEIAEDPKVRPRDRIAAYHEILNRGWGRAPAYANIEGADPLEQDEIAEAISGLVDELARRRDTAS